MLAASVEGRFFVGLEYDQRSGLLWAVGAWLHAHEMRALPPSW